MPAVCRLRHVFGVGLTVAAVCLPCGWANIAWAHEPSSQSRPEQQPPSQSRPEQQPPSQSRPEPEPSRARRVEWEDPGPWTAEFGLMGGPSFSLNEGGVGGFASARAGFRHQRSRYRGGDLAGGLAEGVAILMFGNQIGVDLQGDFLGGRPGGQEWALTVQPVFGVALPDRRARAAVRFPALFGPFALGTGGVGGRVGFVVQLNPRVSLLVTRRFGLDLRGMVNVNFTTGSTAVVGLGGFIR